MGLKNRNNTDLRDYWKGGIRSYLGTTTSSFPNAFMCYTPFAPTAISNGTSIIEVQCDFAAAAIQKILESDKQGRKIRSIEPTTEAEDEWEAYVDAQNAQTLMPFTESWWTGANIPGKKSQMLTYLRGLNVYEQEIQAKLEGWDGFDVRYWDSKTTSTTVLEPDGFKSKAGEASHVEYAQQDVEDASEARDVLRPTAVA